jgi:4-amino-4-deoxy-L-arabinose transferase-like glycosyltransferase
MTTRRALWGLIAFSALLRLVLASSLGLGNDEAYHYLFSVHPDWSYFDHPPMIAVVESLGIALAGGRVSELSLRLGFIALFAGSTWLMARLTTRSYGPRAGLFAALGLNLTAYHSFAAGLFALPDGPLLFFWLLTLDRLSVALESPGRLVPWLWVGMAWGGGLLSKYHAVFLPIGTLLYLALEPGARHWLRRPGPYLALVIGLIVFAPVVAWNAGHGWVSFVFQGGRAVGALAFRPDTLVAALLGQAAYLLPWIWLTLVAILIGRGRRLLGDLGAADRFLLCQAIVPLAVFTMVACTRSVLPHWTLVAFLSLFPMLGRFWDACWEDRPRFPRQLAMMAGGLLLAIVVAMLQIKWGLVQQGAPGRLGLLKVSRDPTLDLYGWDQVGRELKRRGLLDRPGTFLFTSTWYHSGQLAFATRGSSTPVLCYNSWDARNFTYWSRSSDWIGEDGILVSMNHHMAEPHCFDRWFRSIEAIGKFDILRAGAPVREVRLYRCKRQLYAFPFDANRKFTPEELEVIGRSHGPSARE